MKKEHWAWFPRTLVSGLATETKKKNAVFYNEIILDMKMVQKINKLWNFQWHLYVNI